MSGNLIALQIRLNKKLNKKKEKVVDKREEENDRLIEILEKKNNQSTVFDKSLAAAGLLTRGFSVYAVVLLSDYSERYILILLSLANASPEIRDLVKSGGIAANTIRKLYQRHTS